jgi:protein-arginine kinase activator protein McsA
MRCSSCDQAKAELFPKKSILLRGTTLYLCKTCIDKKYEPRWVIILAGRRNPDDVKEIVLKRRYLGRTIEFEEIVT